MELRHLSANAGKHTATGGTTNQYITDFKSDVSSQMNRAKVVKKFKSDQNILSHFSREKKFVNNLHFLMKPNSVRKLLFAVEPPREYSCREF